MFPLYNMSQNVEEKKPDTAYKEPMTTSSLLEDLLRVSQHQVDLNS